MGILRRFFCTHNFEFVRNLYGDQINDWNHKRSVWRCTRCGKLEGRDHVVSRASSSASTHVESPASTSWFFEPRSSEPAPDGQSHGHAPVTPFSSGGGGDFGGSGASASWELSSSCSASSYDSGSTSSESGSCSSSD